MAREMWWWRVETNLGTRDSIAPTRGKAIRNAKYRLVMAGKDYRRPTPRDLAAMRDVQVKSVRCVR